MKWIHLFFSMMFILFAVVQLNDIDPLFWLIVYLSVVPICFSRFKEIAIPKYNLGHAILSSGLLLYTTPKLLSWLQNKSGEFMDPNQEILREFLGIMIVTVVSWIYYLNRKN